MDSSPPMAPKRWTRRFLEELGLVTLYRAPRDTKLLCTQRAVRCFAFGASTLILVSYLNDLGFPEDRIGLFMTLTLVGDVCLSFLLTLVADQMGRKAVLALGSVMMAGAGVVFALSGNFWVLLAGSVFGIISPSGMEIGPFRAVEESTIAWLTPKEERSDVYAWYSLVGTGGVALGNITCGWIVTDLLGRLGWDTIRAYRAIYLLYALLGGVKLLLALSLSRKCEVETPAPSASAPATETAPLLADGNAEAPKKKSKLAILPSIAKDSVPTVIKLALLFGLDSFASGLVSLAWVAYFFKTKFALPAGTLGTIFFTTSIIAALSMLVASSIAKRFGNVKTMVFTHLPSAIFLALIPIPPDLTMALLFMILRSCTQSMDVAPRSAFLAAVLKPTERTAIMGFLNTMKTAAGALAPLLTGTLVAQGFFWISFVTAGSLKALYDIGILLVFAAQEKESRAEEEAAGGQS